MSLDLMTHTKIAPVTGGTGLAMLPPWKLPTKGD
jgi:hypothetical protein